MIKEFLTKQVTETVKKIIKWGLLGLFILLVLSVHTWWKHKKARNKLKSACLTTKEKIFIVLLSEHSSAQAAQTLFSLFDQCACPQRITVGLYECIDRSKENTLDVYKRMAEKHSSSGISYHNQVQVMQRRSSDQGPYGALWEVLDFCLTSEDFVLTCNDTCLFKKGWDTAFISALSESSVLVQPPTSSFPRLSHFKDDMPELTLEPFYAQDSVPILFWLRTCSFSTREFWLSLKNYRQQIKYLQSGIDVFISAQAHKWKFFALKTQYIIPCDSKIPSVWNKSTHKSTQDAKKAIQLMKEKYFHSLLKEVSQGKINARMGIKNHLHDEEINAKYGSRAEFLYKSGQ